MRRAGLAAMLLIAGCSDLAQPPAQDLAVMSSLPLFWKEADPSKALSAGDQRAPIIVQLERSFRVKPIDVFDAETLASFRLLIVAQPRSLAPAELVALDNWIRRGGRLLIFSDPALYWPSDFALGDPRRPPPVTLLDPLLTHWGLSLSATDREDRTLAGQSVRAAGTGLLSRGSKACKIHDGGFRAICRMGKGHAEIIADADLLDMEGSGDAAEKNAAAVISVVQMLAKEISPSVKGN